MAGCKGPAARPVEPGERLRYVDVLRGFALMGILPANLPLFGLAWEAGTVPGRDEIAWLITLVLVDYKFITIFSLLFGVGMWLFRERAESGGRTYRRVMVRRLLAMLLFGVAHGTLIWYGDILTFYALLGLAVFWASSWTPRAMTAVGAALIAVPLVVMVASGVGAQIAPEMVDETEWEWMSAEEETAVYANGTYGEITGMRVSQYTTSFPWMKYFGWRIAGLFLIGMAWAKAGWFTRPEQHRGAFIRLALLGLLFGAPLEAAAGWLSYDESFAGEMFAESCQYAGSLAMSACYAGVLGVVVSGGVPWFMKPVEAIGRTAFTNYILQSVLCTLFFYGYGLGRFGALDRFELWYVMLAVWGIQLVISPMWTARFRFGPLEWLWRTLTYAKLQPMR